MIRKTIIFTIFLLLTWSIFLRYNSFSISQHQWQANIVNAEKFIYDTDSFDNVIVGSSLAQRLQMDSLPNFYNLSLSGQCIFDGLNIIKNKNKLPKNIYIEINVINREENKNFNEIISSPILNVLKKNFLIFRTDKHPLSYVENRFFYPVTNFILDILHYGLKNRIKLFFDLKNKENIADNSVFYKMLNLQINYYSEKTDTMKMDKLFNKLKNNIEFLESKGSKVIFFEMPVNPKLVQLTRACYLRNRIANDFPNNLFIKLPSNIKLYKTSDGVHLTPNEAKIYSDYLKDKIISLSLDN
ncbi:MAG: hypothetical protein H6553_05705 [Chitinophagales bacterium]|nr:hypothetical protein [Chitinophagales bacterium]